MHEGKNKGSITLEQMYTDMIKKNSYGLHFNHAQPLRYQEALVLVLFGDVFLRYLLRFCLLHFLGGCGRLFFEPVTDVTDVAAEDGS